VLYHHRGVFYNWNGLAYSERTNGEIRAAAYQFLDQCVASVRDKQTREWRHVRVKPNAHDVNNLLDALRAAAVLPAAQEAPTWVDHRQEPDPQEIIACTNGLLHLPTRRLLPHTPLFFTHNALEFAYEPDARGPGQWLQFLDQIWPNDEDSIATLQEIFGYCLTTDNSQQKAFLIVGPKRSGRNHGADSSRSARRKQCRGADASESR
jgi:phage/plasmid-associated DNA primase